MTTFKIEVQDGEVTAALNRLAAASRDLSPAMRAIARALRNTTEDAFAQQRSPFGPIWQALQPSTLKGRKGGGAGARILQDSGQLAASITATSDATSATISAGKVYAAIQQFGGKKSEFPHLWGDIPARSFLPIDQAGNLSPQAQREVIEVIQDFLLSAAGG